MREKDLTVVTEHSVIDYRQMELLRGLWMAGIINGEIEKLWQLFQLRFTATSFPQPKTDTKVIMIKAMAAC